MKALKNLTAYCRYLFSGKTSNPPPSEETKQRLTCRRCGSTDTWRIQSDPGLYSDFMRARNLKPFECRMCKYRFYFRANRK